MNLPSKFFALLSLCTLAITAHAATFQYEPLSPTLQQDIIHSKLWKPGCPLPLNRLDLLTFSYYDFLGHEKIGHLIVMDAAASELSKAFQDIYQHHFPIETPQDLKDDLSIKEGSTVAFSCRNMIGQSLMSLHAYGLAIDINTSRNPYAGSYSISKGNPASGTLIPRTSNISYLNRSVIRPGMNETIINIMKSHGFIIWGGNWRDRIDYMHFQTSRPLAEQLSKVDPQSAQTLYALAIQYPDSAEKLSSDSRWQYLYQLYPQRFMLVLQHYFKLLATEPETAVFDQVYTALAGGQ